MPADTTKFCNYLSNSQMGKIVSKMLIPVSLTLTWVCCHCPPLPSFLLLQAWGSIRESLQHCHSQQRWLQQCRCLHLSPQSPLHNTCKDIMAVSRWVKVWYSAFKTYTAVIQLLQVSKCNFCNQMALLIKMIQNSKGG